VGTHGTDHQGGTGEGSRGGGGSRGEQDFGEWMRGSGLQVRVESRERIRRERAFIL